ncbi:MAG: hypothetical protein V1734_03435 [Nanoarchaeota archaeon]
MAGEIVKADEGLAKIVDGFTDVAIEVAMNLESPNYGEQHRRLVDSGIQTACLLFDIGAVLGASFEGIGYGRENYWGYFSKNPDVVSSKIEDFGNCVEYNFSLSISDKGLININMTPPRFEPRHKSCFDYKALISMNSKKANSMRMSYQHMKSGYQISEKSPGDFFEELVGQRLIPAFRDGSALDVHLPPAPNQFYTQFQVIPFVIIEKFKEKIIKYKKCQEALRQFAAHSQTRAGRIQEVSDDLLGLKRIVPDSLEEKFRLLEAGGVK